MLKYPKYPPYKKVKWDNPEQKEEYLNWNKNTSVEVKRLFTSRQRVIFYMYYGLGWGYLRIRRRSGFPRYSVCKVIRMFKEYSKYANYNEENTIPKEQEKAMLEENYPEIE